DGSYFDDYVVDSSFAGDTFAGIDVEDNSKIGGITFLRVHMGFEPYGIYLGHAAIISGCDFDQVQFEGVGNGDIVDSDGTSDIDTCIFRNCAWGGRYSGYAISGQPTSPSLICGTFTSNYVIATNTHGPTPGDMSVALGMYSNTWFADKYLLTAIQAGTIAPIADAAPSNTYQNVVSIGDVSIGLNPATVALTAGEPVQTDGGRYSGVTAATGNQPVFGISLAAATTSQLAWVAKSGQINIPIPAGLAAINTASPVTIANIVLSPSSALQNAPYRTIGYAQYGSQSTYVTTRLTLGSVQAATVGLPIGGH
ncbi:MAG: hypothetical protein KGL39_27835, partial [Patescibacteria group bacterium]|nr:hypothetical protein [Patescibacteria group bacterium]